MHIAHYIQSIDLARGGVVRAVLDMATLLAADRPDATGSRVTVFTQDARDMPDGWTLRGTSERRHGTPEVVPLGPAGPLLRLRPAQARTIRDALADVDVMHIHACWNPANIQLASLACATRTPYVQSIHGMLDDWSMAQSTLKKKIFLAAGGRKTLRGAAAVHLTAAAELDQARRWFAPARGVVVPLVMDFAPFATLPGPDLARTHLAQALDAFDDSAAPLVLFLSRVHYKKGPDAFVRTIAALKARGVPCRGLIAGPGDPAYLREIDALIDELGLRGDVALAGPVMGEAKVSLYQLADVFLLPTSQENFGFVFPESLACETPVITTTGVDTHPDLTASGGAVITDSRAPDALAAAAAPLLTDPDRRRTMGVAGRRWVLETLDPSAVAARFDEMYRSCLR